jgi:hypothetical protein
MSTQTDTEILNALDYEYVPPCEITHRGGTCEGPAVWVRRGRCPACGLVVAVLACDATRRNHPALVASGHQMLHNSAIPACGVASPLADWGITFTPIGGAR